MRINPSLCQGISPYALFVSSLDRIGLLEEFCERMADSEGRELSVTELLDLRALLERLLVKAQIASFRTQLLASLETLEFELQRLQSH